MAWVRIDDQTPRHDKMLKAGPAACWLWVCGIAHAQSQLTDGFISLASLPMIGVAGNVQKLADQLVSVGLFDKVEGGYQVHDYLHHNPSRADVLAKRAEDAERKKAGHSKRIPDGIPAESRLPRARVPSHPIPSHPNQPTTSAVPRPKTFGRIALHRWQLDALIASLGPHADAFDLDAWVLGLSAIADARGLVLDRKTLWPWVQAEFREECARRRLPMAEAEAKRAPVGAARHWTPDDCPHDEKHWTRRECDFATDKAAYLASKAATA